MVTFWYSKVKTKFNGTTLADVPTRYYDDVLTRLVTEGLYDKDGNEIIK